MSLAIRPRHRAAEISTAARSITQRAPVTLTLVRQRAQPTAATIVRLTVTAVFAYLLALLLPNASRPVMAPLTARSTARWQFSSSARSPRMVTHRWPVSATPVRRRVPGRGGGLRRTPR